MIQPIKKYYRKIPLLKNIVHTIKMVFYDGYPGDWVYNKVTLGWLSNRSLGGQLPIVYQLFRFYYLIYFKISTKHRLIGGRELFKIISWFYQITSKSEFILISSPQYKIFLNPSDPRFFQVVHELNCMDTDVFVLKNLLNKGDTFIDIGANHGSFSIVASNIIGPDGCLVVVEPQPKLASLIKKSLASNSKCKYQVHQIAVGNTEGVINLLIPNDTSGSAGVFQAHSGRHQYQTVNVDVKRFDDFIDWRNLCGNIVLKLDIEGSEYAFLCGAKKFIANKKPKLLMEVNPETLKAAGKSRAELFDLLINYGYIKYSYIESPFDYFPIENLDLSIFRNIIFTTN